MKTEYLVNAAIIHIFILIMDEMTMCNVEEVARRGDSIENYLPSDSAVEFYRAFYCLPAQLVLVLLSATVWSALLNNLYIYSRQFPMKKILLLMLLHRFNNTDSDAESNTESDHMFYTEEFIHDS